MENPATWGQAERIVDRVLTDFFTNQEKLITDPTKIVFGRSLERQVTDALREAGLLIEEEEP
jgi:hypothetical protein